MVEDGHESMGVDQMDGDMDLQGHHGNHVPGIYRDNVDGQHHHAQESDNAVMHPGDELGGGMDEDPNQRLSGGEQQLQVEEMSQS